MSPLSPDLVLSEPAVLSLDEALSILERYQRRDRSRGQVSMAPFLSRQSALIIASRSPRFDHAPNQPYHGESLKVRKIPIFSSFIFLIIFAGFFVPSPCGSFIGFRFVARSVFPPPHPSRPAVRSALLTLRPHPPPARAGACITLVPFYI